MSRFDRTLGIVLLLRGGKAISAVTLAQRFEVSPRTIYRDVEILSALGVPVYSQRGRGGGVRLLEGYFLPPVTFTQGEALALVVGLALLGSLRSKPFSADLESAAAKLVAAVPESLRTILVNLERHIGFETLQDDVFHAERAVQDSTTVPIAPRASPAEEDTAVSAFVRGMVDRASLFVRYCSPYRAVVEECLVEPLGAFWDRGYWYLVGREQSKDDTQRLWRADRVVSIRSESSPGRTDVHFDVRRHLERQWLASAMRHWADEAPVRVRMSHDQASRLQRDWYYRHAVYEHVPGNSTVMTFGETVRETVLELLRWLGPGAELLEPQAWRDALQDELSQMLAVYRPHTH